MGSYPIEIDIARLVESEDTELLDEFLSRGLLQPRMILRFLRTDEDRALLPVLLAHGVNLAPAGRKILLDVTGDLLYQDLILAGAPLLTNEEALQRAYLHPEVEYPRYSSGRPVTLMPTAGITCPYQGSNYLPVVRYEGIFPSNVYVFEPDSDVNLFLGNALVAGSLWAAFRELLNRQGYNPGFAAEEEIFELNLLEAYPDLDIYDLMNGSYYPIVSSLAELTPATTYLDSQGSYLSRLVGLDAHLEQSVIQLAQQAGYDTLIYQRQTNSQPMTVIQAITPPLLCRLPPRPYSHPFIWFPQDGTNIV